MWRVSGKTIFPRWQKVRQSAANCKKAKQNEVQVTAQSTIPDEKRYSYYDRNGKQHAHKHQHRCWEDPHFHFETFCSRFLETVGWVGATALCLDVQHKLFRNCHFNEDANKCLFSNFVLAMPQGRKVHLPSARSGKTDLATVPTPSNNVKEVLHSSLEESNPTKLESDGDNGLGSFNEAAVNSISSMENSIGMMFLDHDKKQSFQFFKGSANLGCPKGLFNLAVCYETGCGTAVDLEKAAHYYEKAASKGHKFALYNFAVYTVKGLGGVPPDIKKGMDLLEKAAEKGVLQAQVCLGIRYLEEQNWSKAYEMFKVAAPKDTNAKYYLGMCYENGWGVTPNNIIATEFYAQAARDGHEDATLKLGLHFEQGIDPYTDFSMTLYRMLADKGHEGGKNAMKSLHEKQKSKWRLKSTVPTGQGKAIDEAPSSKSSMHPSASLPDFQSYVFNTSNISTENPKLPHIQVLRSAHVNHGSKLLDASKIYVESKDMPCSLDLAVKSTFCFQHVIARALVVANS